MMPDGILFDMDGTLWDSAESVAVSWTDTVSRFPEAKRVFTVEDIHSIMGMTMREISFHFFGHLPELTRRKVTRECFEEECAYVAKHGGVLYPKLYETLLRLREIAPLFIVSNCQDGYIEAFFAYHGMSELFTDYEDHGRTGLDKSDNLRLLIERNGLKAPVYVGDTMGDYRSCVEADVPFIHASYGFGQVPGVPSIASFDELPDLIKKLPF